MAPNFFGISLTCVLYNVGASFSVVKKSWTSYVNDGPLTS